MSSGAGGVEGEASHNAPASETVSKNDQRKLVRKAERNAWNRLLSIQLDAEWVMAFCALRLPTLPILPNLRCGAWYVPPSAANVERRGCYFKSTDGHTNEWGFSLKRYNPSVLSLIQRDGGCVIVDSTRRGKSMPDALSKTVPIWCAVINEARLRVHGKESPKNGVWDEKNAASLCLPKHVVSPSEAAQIQRRIVDWVDDLIDSDLVVPQLEKPLRPVFVTRSYMDAGQLDDIGKRKVDYYPVVLVSASPMTPTPDITPTEHEVGDDPSLLHAGAGVQELRKDAKFVYVQGSGDDEEMWSAGLTPALLWENENLRSILQTRGDEQALADCVRVIVAQDMLASTTLSESSTSERDVRIGPMFNIWFGRRSTTYRPSKTEREQYRLIVHCDGHLPGNDQDADEKDKSAADTCQVLRLGIESGKRGLFAFREWIPRVIAAAQEVVPGPILLCSAQGDGIGHDLNAGMAICILATCFDAEKRLLDRSRSESLPYIPLVLGKEDVQKRLQWITTFVPQAKAPSRKHMLRINEALLSHRIRAEIEDRRRQSGLVQ